MGPLNSCVKDCVSVNLFAMRMKRFISGWKVCLGVTLTSLWSPQKLQIQLKIKEHSCILKFRKARERRQWRHKSVNLPDYEKIVILEEKIPARPSFLREVQRYCQRLCLQRLRKKGSLQGTGSCDEYTSFSSSENRESYSRTWLPLQVKRHLPQWSASSKSRPNNWTFGRRHTLLPRARNHGCGCGRHVPPRVGGWWPNDDFAKEPVDYQMLVQSFGATSSPSCASLCLNTTALDNLNQFDEETIKTVNRNFYIDDCLESVHMADKAVRLSGQLRELLSRGGFWHTTWISSYRKVIATVPIMEKVSSVVNLDLEDLPVGRTWECKGPWRQTTLTFA